MFKKLGHKMDVFFRWVSIWITRIWTFMTHDIFLLNEEDFSRWKARLVKDAKTVLLMVNTFSTQKIGYQVTALAYRSMMSVVPAIAIGFYLTDGLGLREKFQEILVNNLRDTDIVDKLLQAADNIVQTAESGLFGFISMASFVWIVLSLMITVRQVFNNVWKVEREPNFIKMMGVVFGITILAPFVVIIFFSGSVVILSAPGPSMLLMTMPEGILRPSTMSYGSWKARPKVSKPAPMLEVVAGAAIFTHSLLIGISCVRVFVPNKKRVGRRDARTGSKLVVHDRAD